MAGYKVFTIYTICSNENLEPLQRQIQFTKKSSGALMIPKHGTMIAPIESASSSTTSRRQKRHYSTSQGLASRVKSNLKTLITRGGGISNVIYYVLDYNKVGYAPVVHPFRSP